MTTDLGNAGMWFENIVTNYDTFSVYRTAPKQKKESLFSKHRDKKMFFRLKLKHGCSVLS
jgi:hypothetical protein